MKKFFAIVIVLIICTAMIIGCVAKREVDIGEFSASPKAIESDPITNASENDPITNVEPSAEPDTALPKELVGFWTGTGEPENGGSPISLEVNVNADATGEYTFEQSGYKESYQFTLEKEDSSFTVNIPADNKLGISNCSGTYEYAEGILTLHIKTEFASGKNFSYTVECTKGEPAVEQNDVSRPDDISAETEVDIAAAVEFIRKNESIDGWKPGVKTSEIKKKLGKEDDFPAIEMENMQMFYFDQGYIFSYLNSSKKVTTVSAIPPAAGKTARGIGIGSTEAEVRELYGDGINTELSTDEKIVFGDNSVQIEFIFENGQVNLINLSY